MDGSNGGFGDATFSTLDPVRRRGEKKKEKGGEQGMAWTSGKEELVQYGFTFLLNQLGKLRVENSHRCTHKSIYIYIYIGHIQQSREMEHSRFNRVNNT